jgi:hypothetical protein
MLWRSTLKPRTLVFDSPLDLPLSTLALLAMLAVLGALLVVVAAYLLIKRWL